MKQLVLIFFFMLLSYNSFSQDKKITKKQFDQIIPGTWIANYYVDTSHTSKEYLSFVSNIVDTLYVNANFEVTQKRTMVDSGDVLIYKEKCSYDERRKSVDFFSEENQGPTLYKLLSLSQNEIVVEFYGISEDAPKEKKRVEIRYKRVKSR